MSKLSLLKVNLRRVYTSLYVICLLLLASFTFLDEEKTIIFYGDSLTAGYGLTPEQAFPALVEKYLGEKGHNYKVVNAGVSGETSAGGLSRINWVLNQPVDIFILELGANDGLRGLPLTQTRENLQGIIDRVKAKNPGVKVVVAGMMVPPNMGESYASEFISIFPEIARQNDADLIPFLLEGVAGDPTLNLPDGIHPNPEGQKIVANTVMKVLENLL